VRVGYASFNGASGSSDTDVWNVLGNARYTFNPVAPARVFVNGGAGLYHFDPGDAEFGFNVGGGVHVPVKPRFAVEATYNYHHALTASPNRRYSQVQGGVVVMF
jgi:opacity protein-like surface antigen